jgi:hypothetical protein
MARPVQTHIFCLDDHRTFSDDVKKRFSDSTRYIVTVTHNRDEFLRKIDLEKDHHFCKVAIIGLHDTRENFEMAEHLIGEIKKIDIRTGIIIVASSDKLEDARKIIRFNVDSFIPLNANTILRIHNLVKKLISEHNLLIYRKRRTISAYALLIFLTLAAAFAILAYFRLPMYF